MLLLDEVVGLVNSGLDEQVLDLVLVEGPLDAVDHADKITNYALPAYNRFK